MPEFWSILEFCTIYSDKIVAMNECDFYTAIDKLPQRNQGTAHALHRVKVEILINSSHEGKSLGWWLQNEIS